MLAPVRLVAFSLVAVLACAALAGCSSDPQREYAGEVVDDTVVVQAPILSMPAVDLDAGFAPGVTGSVGTGGSTAARRSGAATAIALTGIGSVVRVTRVSVAAGDDVKAGQEIARLDSAALDANIAVARAALSTARARAGVLDEALDTVASSRTTLASNRTRIDNAARQLAETRAKLVVQLADLKALLAKVMAAGALPDPAGALPDPAVLRAGIAKLTAALAKIDAGLTQVNAGRAKLSSATTKLADTRTQLQNLRALAHVGADAAEVGVRLSEYQRELAVLRSPADGLVVAVAPVGAVMSLGATVARIRRSGAPRVTTWLAPDALGAVAVGSSADVSADWFPGADGADTVRGRVSALGTRAEYPPTAFATSEIHLLRAIRVEITLSDTAGQPALPPGAPVDVRFLGR